MTEHEKLMKEIAKETEDKQLQILLEKLFYRNGVPESELVEVFSGVASFDETEKFYVVKEIHTIGGHKIEYNLNDETFIALLGKSRPIYVDVNDKVVFVGRIRKPLSAKFPIYAAQSWSYKMLGINDTDRDCAWVSKICEGNRLDNKLKLKIENFLKTNTNIAIDDVLFDKYEKLLSMIRKLDLSFEQIKELSTVTPNIVDAELEKLNNLEAQRFEKQNLEADIVRLQSEKSGLEAETKNAKEEYNFIQRQLCSWDKDVDFSDRNEENKLVLNHENLMRALCRTDHLYSLSKVYEFLMALNTTQIITLCGSPGSGKTTFVFQMAKVIGAECHMIEVQNNWTDKSDILGYYNPINQTYQSTQFLDAILEARQEENECKEDSRLHIVCFDEMNLSRIEYYFASFLSLLQLPEKQQQTIKLIPQDIQRQVKQYQNEHKDDEQYVPKNEEEKKLHMLIPYMDFQLPKNIRFVGTMNVDQTTNFFSPKVIDRSLYIDFDFNRNQEEEYNKPEKGIKEKEYFAASEFCKPANDEWKSLKEDFAWGNYRFEGYVSEMWPLYKCVAKDAPYDFIEEIVLTKVLPKITKTSEYNKYKVFNFIDADKRFESACATGKELEDNAEDYSFFGGI